ncbi:septum formation inhibitor Maf [Shewanella yunxiaonensis]|uniref:7-methyl-GTP pyrophosphatase n=1 Tax=Shewanella yunxiaonensis TaxID=2829809 RepID=A0ABX7YY27_9GAMM|nr:MULTISPECIES: Maf family protein [Shewanella]MDF0533691.1 Maf family protein [Shewanella sp. A32]QUN07604.1 septum formation inhibitor Maf [Shewanella yunxiaonensis]
MARQLVLASTSSFRKSLLQKLGLPFITCAPDVDETPLPGESAQALVTRLAQAKATAGGKMHPGSLSIGSDQVAVIDGDIMGKPYTEAKACDQLARASGKAITFYTGLALYDDATKNTEVMLEPFTVHFRRLTDQQIANYVAREQPLYCAGSFMCEGLGIALFERLEGDDPNALIGLPLIALTRLLAKHGIDVLG